MKKLLILIVGIAIFLHFYPQPEFEQWLYQQKERHLDEYLEVFDTKVSMKVDKIWTDLKPELHSFKPKEQELLREITASKSATKAFYRDYCKTRKRNFAFQDRNQKRVCLTIHKYVNLL
jgi:hypothetical protein